MPTYLSDWVPDSYGPAHQHIVDQMDLSEITNGYSVRGEETYYPALLLKLWFYG
ncbi:hypothetical protein D3C75_1388990 [compost metagenome]